MSNSRKTSGEQAGSAIAAPGAMSVMLWNSTSRNPIAPSRSLGAVAADSWVMATSLVIGPV